MESPEKDQINWLLTCRVCLKTDEYNMKCIFSDISMSEDIATKIIKCGGVPVNICDGMPDRICDRCALDLEIACRFRSACQQSYQRLLKMISTRDSKDTSLAISEDGDITEFKIECDQDEVETKYINSIELAKDMSQRDSFEMLYIEEEALIDGYSVESDVEAGEAECKSEEAESCTESIPAERKLDDKCESKLRRRFKQYRKNNSSEHSTNYICYLCGNLYKNKSKLSQHIKLHTSEKAHECEICKKKFALAAQLSRHMNSHTGNRPYKCKYCSSSFADPSTCIKHERIHTNVRPFKCLECGKAFAYSNVLKVHQKTHTGEKPFSCSICDKKFSQQHHKNSHEKTHLLGAGAIGNKAKG